MRVSAELETRANLLRREALQSLTIALAGSDTKRLWDLLTAFFGADHTGDEEDPWDFLDGAPEIPPPLPLTDTDSDDDKVSTTSVATTQSAPAGPTAGQPLGEGAKVKCRRPKVSAPKDHLDDVCDLDQAIRIYPQSESTLKETGIPEHLLVQREQLTTGKGGSLYLCRHELCQNTAYYAQSPAGLYSHVRRKHLGMALACPYCTKKLYWNLKGWHTHMDKYHKEVPHYGHQLADESTEAASLLVQLKADPDALKEEAVKQEKQLRKGLHPAKREPTVTFKDTEPSPAATTPQPIQPEGSSDDEAYQPGQDTEDSSADSSSSTSSENDDDPPQSKETSATHTSLSLGQLQAVREGATALRGQPTLEALEKHPSAWKQPTPTHTAIRYAPPSVTPAAQLASSLVLMDMDPEMPELEKTPPRPFPKRRKKEQD